LLTLHVVIIWAKRAECKNIPEWGKANSDRKWLSRNSRGSPQIWGSKMVAKRRVWQKHKSPFHWIFLKFGYSKAR
jgi:hypothetical protein